MVLFGQLWLPILSTVATRTLGTTLRIQRICATSSQESIPPTTITSGMLFVAGFQFFIRSQLLPTNYQLQPKAPKPT